MRREMVPNRADPNKLEDPTTAKAADGEDRVAAAAEQPRDAEQQEAEV